MAENGSVRKVTATTAGIRVGGRGKTQRILVVEDCRPLRVMLTKLLTGSGYAVDAAENGYEALAVLQRSAEPFSLIMTDLNMPEMSGIEMLAHLRKDGKELPPILICSDQANRETVELVRKLGIAGYVLKPFKTQQVLDKVREVIAY